MGQILILMEKERDKELLYDYLKGIYNVIFDYFPEEPELPIDLCIVDGLALQRYKRMIKTLRGQKNVPYLPILLVTAKKDVQLITNALRKNIDDIIITPIEKRELHTRVEVLLRMRRFSVQLLQQKEDVLRALRKELLESEAFQAIHLNATPIAVFNVDPQGTVLSWNRAAEEMFVWTAQEVLGSKLPIYQGDQEEKFNHLLAWIKNGQPVNGVELVCTCRDGSSRYGALFGAAVKDSEENLVSILCLVEDITERKRYERELAASEEKYRKLFFDHAAVKLIIDPATGAILDANPAAERFYGWTREELKTMRIQQINTLTPEEVQEEMEKARTLKRVHFEFRHRRADGSIRDVEVFSSRIEYEGREVLHSIIHDVTESKQYERELHKLREQYERFFNEDLAGIFLATADGTVINCNPAFVRIFGFESKEEAVRTNLRTLFQSPEEQSRLLSQLLKERKLANVEIKMLKRDGSSLYIVANVVGHFSEDGKLIEMQGYFFDDTIRRQLEERVRESQKFETLGTVASGIAHDFNNILGIILGHTSLLPAIKTNEEKFTQSVNTILGATERGASLVKQMLTFARKAETVLKALNINDIVREIEQMLKETFPKTIEIQTSLAPDILPILADETQMHQILLNLAVNARDAMPTGGTLTLKTRIVDPEDLPLGLMNVTTSKYVQISVSDTGIGMDERTRKRIFEPFFTTKPKGQGTGLGLSVVYGIVIAHNGYIDVQSEVGQGTTFIIYLPAAEKTVLDFSLKTRSVLDIPGGTEHVLLVEDEEALRQLLRDLLESKGYSVLCATDGVHALELYSEHQKSIDVVISDVGLPRMGGEDVFRELKKINPHVCVILASGYIDPMFRAKLLNEGVSEFIAKPYRPEDVLLKLRKVLDSTEYKKL